MEYRYVNSVVSYIISNHSCCRLEQISFHLSSANLTKINRLCSENDIFCVEHKPRFRFMEQT